MTPPFDEATGVDERGSQELGVLPAAARMALNAFRRDAVFIWPASSSACRAMTARVVGSTVVINNANAALQSLAVALPKCAAVKVLGFAVAFAALCVAAFRAAFLRAFLLGRGWCADEEVAWPAPCLAALALR